MPWRACGRLTSTSSPPRLSISSSVSSKVRPTPSSTPSAPEPSSAGTPKRSPCRSVRLGMRTSSGSPSEVESQGSWPTRWREQQRRVGDGARQRPALVERRRERDHAVARDRSVGRLQARRSRTARRAGGSIPRCRSRSPTARGLRPPRPRTRRSIRPAHARGPTGCARCRSPSSRSRSPSRTRPCWSCRSSARLRRRAGARRSRCTAACVPRGSATRRSSARPPCRRGP